MLLDSVSAGISDQKRVKIPPYLIEQALQTAPKSFTLNKRDGTPHMVMSGTKSYFGAIPDQPDYLDPKRGERQKFMIKDMVEMCFAS